MTGRCWGGIQTSDPSDSTPPGPADHQRYRTPKVQVAFPAECRLSGDDQLGLNESRRAPSRHQAIVSGVPNRDCPRWRSAMTGLRRLRPSVTEIKLRSMRRDPGPPLRHRTHRAGEGRSEGPRSLPRRQGPLRVPACDGELVRHGAEQEAIREMIALRAQGRPLRTIAAAVAAKGFRISHEGVAGVLKSAARSVSDAGPLQARGARRGAGVRKPRKKETAGRRGSLSGQGGGSRSPKARKLGPRASPSSVCNRRKISACCSICSAASARRTREGKGLFC